MKLIDQLLPHARALAALAVLGFSLGVAYGTYSPKWYESTISLVASGEGANPAAGLAAALPGLSAMLLPGAAAGVERIEAVLATNAVTDQVIRKFRLDKRYDEKHIEQVRRALWKRCGIRTNRKAGVVSLTCEDTSPQLARDMAAYFGEVGNAVFRKVSRSSAGEERTFLERRVTEAEREVAEAAQALKEFQERYKIVDISEQGRAVVGAMATIQSELLNLEMQRDYAKSFAASSEASVMQMERKIAVLRRKLGALEDDGKPEPAEPSQQDRSFFPAAMSLPQRQAQVEPLFRELKIREAVLLALTQRYEMAKVDEARDTSTFQVLDPPTVPTQKSRPSRLKASAIGGFAGLLLGALMVLGRHELRRRSASRATDHVAST
jgi:capsule polysaccharide export protein KpsE/RkpR